MADSINQQLERARMADGVRMSNERLDEVFDLVKDPADWKNSIDARVPKAKATAAEIETAVSWNVGALPMVADRGDYWEVIGEGYYDSMVD